MRDPIYKPKGAALEYANYALNIYTGCPHGCSYCYVPAVLRKSKAEFHSDVRPRDGIIEAVETQLAKGKIKDQLIHLSVGEWTGLVDRNGVKIFEGDIIACRHWSTDRTGEAKSSVFFTGRVRYSYGDFYLSGCCRSEYLRDFGDREVIGNIHDNPELLEGGEE